MVEGKYIIIHHHPNKYFIELIKFVLEHFDKIEYDNSVIIIGDYINHDVKYYRKIYPNKKIIIYNWEQLVDGNKYFNIAGIIGNMIGADEIWDYDLLNVEYFKYFDVKVDKVFNFKYTESIKDLKNQENPEIDVLFYGYFNDVRYDKFKDIFTPLYHDYKIMMLTGLDKEDQKKYIENAKIIINVHAMIPWSRQEQERIGYCLINEKCVLSEVSQINYFGNAIVEEKLQNLSNGIKHLLKDDLWRDVAIDGHKMFKNNECNIIRNEV